MIVMMMMVAGLRRMLATDKRMVSPAPPARYDQQMAWSVCPCGASTDWAATGARSNADNDDDDSKATNHQNQTIVMMLMMMMVVVTGRCTRPSAWSTCACSARPWCASDASSRSTAMRASTSESISKGGHVKSRTSSVCDPWRDYRDESQHQPALTEAKVWISILSMSSYALVALRSQASFAGGRSFRVFTTLP
jgi:hypothetical protein